MTTYMDLFEFSFYVIFKLFFFKVNDTWVKCQQIFYYTYYSCREGSHDECHWHSFRWPCQC